MIRHAVLFLALLVLGACVKPKLDATTPATLERSLQRVAKDLTAGEQAIVALVVLGRVAEASKGGDQLAWSDVHKALHGKTSEQLIAWAAAQRAAPRAAPR
jgi:hypothetical protein